MPKGLSGLTWSNIARCYSSSDQYNCSTRRNGVAYSSPDLKGLLEGFNVQWGWFEDDDWGAALRYKNSFSLWGGGTGASADDTWLFSANVAYENLRDERLQAGGGGEASGNVPIRNSATARPVNKTTFFQREFNEWAGSIASSTSRAACLPWAISARPNPTTPMSVGFYHRRRAPDMTAWDVQAGIQKKFWSRRVRPPSGAAMAKSTTAGLQAVRRQRQSLRFGRVPALAALAAISAASCQQHPEARHLRQHRYPVEITGSEVDRWFLAFDQGFESAAMHLYLAYQHFNADINLVTRTDPLG